MSSYEVIVLFDGYCIPTDAGFRANCTCTLVKGPLNIIVDTMTAWDGDRLIEALKKYELSPNSISHVICTHQHSDHIGCNYLFKNATIIVGLAVTLEDFCYGMDHSSEFGKQYVIDENLRVVASPGHTLQDVSVLVKTANNGVVAVTGDLFENETDLLDDSVWKSAGSDDEELQIKSRKNMLVIADWIVPGHGPMFRVKDSYRSL